MPEEFKKPETPGVQEPMSEEERPRFAKRAPSVDAKIADIPKTKGRVAVIGTVVSKNNKEFNFVLDDGEAKVLVITNNIDDFEKLEEGKLARVLGKTMGEGEETEIMADIIQDFSKFDLALWKKAMHY